VIAGWVLASWLGCGGHLPIFEPCEEPADCAVPDGVEAACLGGGDAGFCTATCAVDADCAAIDGTGSRQDLAWVCAPFESEAGLHCFPSCEEAPEDETDPDAACPDGTTCRSTGGGSDNRKICFPEDLG
jgi:hypothetical protein